MTRNRHIVDANVCFTDLTLLCVKKWSIFATGREGLMERRVFPIQWSVPDCVWCESECVASS